jgi:hypothetical protein
VGLVPQILAAELRLVPKIARKLMFQMFSFASALPQLDVIPFESILSYKFLLQLNSAFAYFSSSFDLKI